MIYILYFIKKDLLYNSNTNNIYNKLSDFDLAILMLLNKLYIHDKDYISCNINNLYYDLFSDYPDYDLDRISFNNIIDSINHLVKLGLINVIDSKSNCYILGSCNLYINTKLDNFIAITDIELSTIIKAKEYKLLRYFLVLVSTINNNSKTGFTAINLLARDSNISKTTAIKYNSLLEDLKLIYIARSNTIRRYDNGIIKKSSNTYGRFVDRDSIIKIFEDYNNTIASINGEDVDYINRRSIKSKYNHFVKCINNNTKYKRSIKELYDDCIKYNKSLSESDISSGDMNKLDLSIFDGKA